MEISTCWVMMGYYGRCIRYSLVCLLETTVYKFEVELNKSQWKAVFMTFAVT